MLGDFVGGQGFLDIGLHQQHGLGQLGMAGAKTVLQRNTLTLATFADALHHQLFGNRASTANNNHTANTASNTANSISTNIFTTQPQSIKSLSTHSNNVNNITTLSPCHKLTNNNNYYNNNNNNLNNSLNHNQLHHHQLALLSTLLSH